MGKICTKCGIEKEFSEFSMNKNRKNGLNPWCKICYKDYMKEYRTKNKDEIARQIKDYYTKNKEKITERDKEYYKQNKDKIVERNKEYYTKNKDKIAERMKEYKNERYKNDPGYRLLDNIRSRVRKALESNDQTKTSRTAQFVDVKAINEHIGPRPEGYHLDHIIPLSKFDLTNLEHLKLAHLPQNLRFIPASENTSKNDKIIPELINSCPVLTEIARKISL